MSAMALLHSASGNLSQCLITGIMQDGSAVLLSNRLFRARAFTKHLRWATSRRLRL